MLRLVTVVISFAWLLAVPGFATASGYGGVYSDNPVGQIEKAYDDGDISFDEKSRLVILAIKYPDQLPGKYQAESSVSGIPTNRSATLLILDILHHWEELSVETQNLYTLAFTRPTRHKMFDSPYGFFKLHYDTLGAHQVPLTDSDENDVPDYVERVASYLDTALDVHAGMGYFQPVADSGEGGDELYDVYFEHLSEGFYGYTVPEGDGPEPWNDIYSHMALHKNYIGFVPNDDPEGDVAGTAKISCAHELHHAVQFAYDHEEEMWFMDLDAVFMEEIVFDQVNDNLSLLPTFMTRPDVSLLNNGNHRYSCFVWGLYLAQAFDTTLMRGVWEGALYDAEVFDVLTDSLPLNYGWEIDSAFVEFCVWNYITGGRDDGLHYEDAAIYPQVNLSSSHILYPVEWRETNKPPAGYASQYIQFFPGLNEGVMRFYFDGADGAEWTAIIVKSPTINTHETERITLNPVTADGFVDVHDFETYYSVALIGINTGEYSDTARFQYHARIPYDVAVEPVTTDSAVYSGGGRDWQLSIQNPSPLGELYEVIYSDSVGWVTPDTLQMFIQAETDSVIGISVDPPQGTALSERSRLFFDVTSQNDPDVTDSGSVPVITWLQRGDVDFTGTIDGADLALMIDHLFINFSPLIPVDEAGNMDCEGDVSGIDLSYLISCLFITLESSPCNPY